MAKNHPGMFIIGALYFSEPKHNIMNLNVQFDKNNLGDYISTHVKKELEEWSGQELDKKIIFHGIRRYLRGSWMALHLDKLPTHIISAILQVSTIKLMLIEIF